MIINGGTTLVNLVAPRHAKMSLRVCIIINAGMPWYDDVHHHLSIYDHTGPVWKLFQPCFHIGMHDKDA